MAVSTSRAEETATAVLVVLVVACIFRWSDYSVRPRGVIDWALIVGIGASYWLFAKWGESRLRQASFYSRQHPGVRIALAVPILSSLLLLTAYLIRLALEEIGSP